MNVKKNIIRISVISLWVVLATSVLVLLVAAVNVKNHKSCKGIDIEILGVKEIYFLDKDDILKIVQNDDMTNPAGKGITSFNLRGLETLLEKNIWVKDAELFFDNNLVLHINILEKEPVARVFANNSYSFYIDSSGSKMPLNDKMNVKLPVFTGFPDKGKLSQMDDSLLIDDMKKLTLYILNDKFWMAQISQIAITPDRNFEMIPTLGNHIIQFGNGDNYESKFKRLFIFYKEVLSKVGLDKYSRISVQYDRQVVGTKKGIITSIDSVQTMKNIRNMIEEAKKINEDAVYVPEEDIEADVLSMDSVQTIIKVDSVNEIKQKTVKANRNTLKPVTVPVKPAIANATINKLPLKQTELDQKPKAVMKKIN